MTTGAHPGPLPCAAMSLADLAGHLASAKDHQLRWRFVAEFLEEYAHEPAVHRPALLAEEPASTGDERWDVFLAALAEHCAGRDQRRRPAWAEALLAMKALAARRRDTDDLRLPISP